MPKVSIIVPIYNAEKFLPRCLYSILEQTLKDIEIILVDDGSTDSSGQICEDFANLDNRIKVIHNKNSGMGVSYNTGINMASGEYIGFIESDDKADINMFENLYNLAIKKDLDIAKSAWFSYFMSNNHKEKNMQLAKYNGYEVINIKTNPEMLLYQFTVWSAIYKTSFLREKNVYYLETPGASYQDVAFSYKALCLADKVSITPDAYVYYTCDNENSSINSKAKVNVIFDEYEEVDRFLDKNPEIKPIVNSVKLLKQYRDYRWNFDRVAPCFKEEFLKRFVIDFKKYKTQNELDQYFYSNIDIKEFDFILYGGA